MLCVLSLPTSQAQNRLAEQDDGIEIALHEGFWVMHGNCFYLPGQQGEGRSDFAGDLFTFLVIR